MIPFLECTREFETTAHLFALENCSFDLNKQGFVLPEPDQSICFTTGYAYVKPLDLQTAAIRNILRLYTKMNQFVIYMA